MSAKAKKSPAKKDSSDIPTAPPVFDVSKPGKTAADPSSRPLIVTHKPMIKQDPMVASSDDADKPVDKPLKPKKEAVIAPAATEADDTHSEETAEEQKEDSKPNDSDTASTTGDLAEKTPAEKQKSKKEEEKIAQKAAELENLIQSKKYNLPIHDAAYGGSSTFTKLINFLLIIMLLAALFVLAVDAELIDAGLELPFDLIK